MLPGHIFLPAGEDLHDAFASNPAVEVLELEPEQRYYVTSTILVGAGTVTIKLSALADREDGSKPALIEVDTDGSFAAVAAGGSHSLTLNPNSN